MKQLLTFAFLAILVSGCRKEVEFSASEVVARIRSVITDSMGNNAAASIDFGNITQVKVSDDSVYYLVRSKWDPNYFVALWMDRSRRLKRGVAVHLAPNQPGRKPWEAFDGTITIRSLNGTLMVQSGVDNGFISSMRRRKRHLVQGIASRLNVAPVEPDPYETLSEVVVVGVRSSGGGYSYSTWMSINAMFSAGGGGWYYAPTEGGGSGSSTYHGGIYETDPIRIDDETAVTHPAIDVRKYLNCFDQLPDAGATYSIEILTDIPIDSDPDKLVDWRAGSAGHTFLQLRKQVGGQIIMQNIGFYPVQSWKVTLTNAPVPAKFVDNGNHEFNASLLMNVSPEEFRRALNELHYLAGSSYDLDEFNCTDLAVRVFNAARLHKLDIPLYQIPGGITAAGTSTPQGLFNKLKEMQGSGGPEAANISIPGVKGFVSYSNGPCN